MKKLLKISLVLFVLTLLIGCGKQSPEEAALQAQKNLTDRLNLTILLEDSLGLEEVLISQNEENLLVRFKAPTIKGEELSNGLAQVFAFIDQRASDEIETIKLIFTINHVDSMIIAVPREDISLWTDSEISNKEFINKFDITFLIK